MRLMDEQSMEMNSDGADNAPRPEQGLDLHAISFPARATTLGTFGCSDLILNAKQDAIVDYCAR